MNSKQLRTFDRVLVYVKAHKPDFEHTYDSFKIYYTDDEYSIRNWNLEDVPEPTEAQLRLITTQEIEASRTQENEKRDGKDPAQVIKKLISRVEQLETEINKLIKK